jgi:redox-sensitive bicupin YhaK (pirin superfamily)
MSDSVLQIVPLGNPPWPTVDPFLFCVHHVDHYPRGNDVMGPDASLAGRQIGQDFEGLDGWRMYHGTKVPGFPQHPHRGFETVTLARRGYIDHSDSMGAAARFGRGDVQWMTAGAGVVHSEMFPLVDREHPNPVELFQIWLNLPAADKAVEPYFTMLWDESIPRSTIEGDDGRPVGTVTVVAGSLGDLVPPPPPPNSWAARAEADVAIWVVRLERRAHWELPPARGADTVRTLYVFEGGMQIDGHAIAAPAGVVLRADRPVLLESTPALWSGSSRPTPCGSNVTSPDDVSTADAAECLLLQGRPIGEPVEQYGPFVMNDRAGVERAFADYRRTGFGGWPWSSDDPVHPRDSTRFARRADGRVETPTG